jgi:hypothetical protein
MNANEATGLLMLCLCGLVPFGLGIGATLYWQRRILRYGWPGALLPGLIRRWIERG